MPTVRRVQRSLCAGVTFSATGQRDAETTDARASFQTNGSAEVLLAIV